MTYFWEVWEDVEGDARESRETERQWWRDLELGRQDFLPILCNLVQLGKYLGGCAEFFCALAACAETHTVMPPSIIFQMQTRESPSPAGFTLGTIVLSKASLVT